MLRNCGQDVNGETVGGRHIDRYELAVTVHQSGDEMDITGKSVELCDDQSCLLQAAFRVVSRILCKRLSSVGVLMVGHG
jgi:hypothetical protein